MNKKFNYITFKAILFLGIASLSFVGLKVFAADPVPVPVDIDITNSPPVITATISDGGSHVDAQTNPGSNVTFTATAADINANQYYLAICKTDVITAGDNDVPSCDGGNWSISAATNNAAEATATYAITGSEGLVNPWYAFVCDKLPTATGPACFAIPVKASTTFPDENGITLTAKSNGRTGSNINLVITDTVADCPGTAATLAALILGSSPDYTLDCDLDDSEATGDPALTGTALAAAITDGTTTTIDDDIDATAAGTGATQIIAGTFYLNGGKGGDQGSAYAKLTFTGRPADTDYVTIDGINYEFEISGGVTGGRVTVDISSAKNASQVAAALVAVEAGTHSFMATRAGEVHIYSDSKGSSAGTIGSIEGQDTNTVIAFSAASLTQVTNANASPFYAVQRPEIGTVTFGDTANSGGQTLPSGTIEPGDTVYINTQLSSFNTVDMYVCNGAGFTYGGSPACTGSLICSDLAVDTSTEYAECNDGGGVLAPVPKAHGSHSIYIYIQDSNQLEDAQTNNTHQYTVTDVPPIKIGYSATEAPAPTAGGNHDIDFSVTVEDENGDGDIISVSGVFFDDNLGNNPEGSSCDENESDCYYDTSCTLTGVDGDSQLVANCTVTFWFNANSSNWDVRGSAEDELGTVDFADAGVVLANPALLGISVSESGIDYGAVYAGDESSVIPSTMQNYGNQGIDIYLEGDDMSSGGNTIPLAQQKWHHTDNNFYWDTTPTAAGPYTLVDTASSTDDETGCLNRDVAVRITNDSTATDEVIYWILRIPSTQREGSYSGSNVFQATASETCTAAQSY